MFWHIQSFLYLCIDIVVQTIVGYRIWDSEIDFDEFTVPLEGSTPSPTANCFSNE